MKEELQALSRRVRYDPLTGDFFWIIAPRHGIGVGDKAGNISDQGYVRIGLLGKSYKAHRLAWLFTYGFLPREIDHINGIRSDNRIENLRLATRSENTANTKRKPTSITGFKGVTKVHTGFAAKITKHGVIHYLGYFATAEEAHAAYCAAAVDVHGEFARVA